MASLFQKFNICFAGSSNVERTLLLAHGYGCDQNIWRLVLEHFPEFKIVLFDHVGSGRSNERAYDFDKYATLHGYADDVLAICNELKLQRVCFVGHSVSAMIGLLAAVKKPDCFEQLVMVGPSPCYINDGDYIGGFNKSDIMAMMEALENNFMGWTSTITPVIMRNEDRPELTAELANSFCRMNPAIAKHFARTTFLSDNRNDLPKLKVPTLVVQCQEDAIAPPQVGEYVVRSIGSHCSMALLNTVGHCPHVSAPGMTAAAIRKFLQV